MKISFKFSSFCSNITNYFVIFCCHLQKIKTLNYIVLNI